MGIQINGQTDIISATDGSLTISGADLPTVTNLNATGIITATSFSGPLTGNVTGNLTGNVNSTGVTTVTTLRATSIVGVSSVGVTTAYVTSINEGPISGARNRIINGDMRIDQRNAGVSTVVSSVGYTLDRWLAANSTDGAATVIRSATAPVGFTSSLLCTTTTADASLSTSQRIVVVQRIEGLNVSDLAWGTTSAVPVTLSFWVRSSLTGTFSGSVRNSAANRSYPFTYTISSADTFEYKTITIPGDTTGTWLTDSNIGIELIFSLGSGPTHQGTANTWQASGSFAVSGETPVIGTLNATWYITGVQLEAGTVATPFERRSYGQELALCQRYYERYELGINTVIAMMQCYTTSQAFGGPIKYAVTKRAAPTITLPGAGNGANQAALVNASASFPATIGTHSLNGITTDMARVDATGYTGAFTAGNVSAYISTNIGTAVIQISAEL
jgi:hypothetical protein